MDILIVRNIGFNPEDWLTLEGIAKQKKTTRPELVRDAVRKLIQSEEKKEEVYAK